MCPLEPAGADPNRRARVLFQPIDKYNERWLELEQFPARRPPEKYPGWQTLMDEQHNLFARIRS